MAKTPSSPDNGEPLRRSAAESPGWMGAAGGPSSSSSSSPSPSGPLVRWPAGGLAGKVLKRASSGMVR